MPPRISVVMIFFNSERYITEAIDSVLAQTFTDFELLLVDDGSTDTSSAIARDYVDRSPTRCAIWSTRATLTAACPLRAI